MRKRLALLVAAMALVALLPGCAVVKKENRYVSRVVEATLWPDGVTARIAAAPLVAPLWVTGLVVDAVVINPVMSLPRALGTAFTAYGLIPPVPFVDILVFPVRVVMFPVAFVGAEIVYSVFPM